MSFYALIRPLLFRLSPELAHELVLDGLSAAARLGLLRLLVKKLPANPKRVMGIDFPNPVGLAAGLDKNGDAITALAQLGFGFIELGTVTPKPQDGNPKPRLFRLTQQQALINRMGFNNRGVDYLVERIKAANFTGILGINIGKNKTTSLEQASGDYLACMEKVYPLASYITINISSPNTQQLRQLQQGKQRDQLLSELKAKQLVLEKMHQRYVPLVVKVSPDLTKPAVKAMAKALLTNGIDGLICSNTTTDRKAIGGSPYAQQTGGLSGAPLAAKSNKIISEFAEALQDKVPIIGVGGIVDGNSAEAKIAAGASLVQLYTGLIYRGPALIKAVYDALL